MIFAHPLVSELAEGLWWGFGQSLCPLAEMAKDKPRLCAALEVASAAIAKVRGGPGGPLTPRGKERVQTW